jgi:NADH-quinone oxidoreductase subunit A
MDNLNQLQNYFPVAVAFGVAVALALVLIGLSNLLGPRKPSKVKGEPFECGSVPIGDARDRFGVKFYVLALLFIVFDVEAVFLYPWAVQLRALGWGGYVSVSIFVFTLVLGLIYVLKKGVLDWGSSSE